MNVLKRYTKRLAPVVVAFALLQGLATPANAAALTAASTRLSNSTPAEQSDYLITASSVSLAAINCIRVEFDTAADGTGGAPAGLDLSTVDATLGATTWVPTPATWAVNDAAADVVEVTLVAGETPAGANGRTLTLLDIGNPNAGSFFVRLNTYSNDDCSTGPVDSVVMVAATTANTTVSVVVDPTLTFTVADNAGANCNGVAENGTSSTATAVNLGRASTGANRFQAQQLHASTNADGGYTVYARNSGTGMVDSQGNEIDAHASANGTPGADWAAGVERFAYTTDDATLGTGAANRFTDDANKWAGLTSSDAEVHYNGGPVDESSAGFACIGYQVGIAGSTPAGSYSTTVIYTAVPVF